MSVYVTVGTPAEAERLARELLERRLIACANTWPVRSFFRWDGKVQREDETAIWMKTDAARVDELLAVVPTLHGYDVPCVEVFPAAASLQAFARWVHEETTQA